MYSLIVYYKTKEEALAAEELITSMRRFDGGTKEMTPMKTQVNPLSNGESYLVEMSQTEKVIIETCARHFGVPASSLYIPREFIKRKGTGILSDPAQLAMYIMRSDFGISPSRIAMIMNRARGTIGVFTSPNPAGRQAVLGRLLADRHLKKKYDEILLEINKVQADLFSEEKPKLTKDDYFRAFGLIT